MALGRLADRPLEAYGVVGEWLAFGVWLAVVIAVSLGPKGHGREIAETQAGTAPGP